MGKIALASLDNLHIFYPISSLTASLGTNVDFLLMFIRSQEYGFFTECDLKKAKPYILTRLWLKIKSSYLALF